MRRLTEARFSILKAVADLHPNAYGVTIGKATGLSIATIYSELGKMQDDYLVGSKHAPGGQERGLRPKLLWSLTHLGRSALAQSEEKK